MSLLFLPIVFLHADGAVLGINSNWELLAPRGFRFYLPGTIGLGWFDATTIASVRTQLVNIPWNEEKASIEYSREESPSRSTRLKLDSQRPMLHCVAEECPLLLRKAIAELFSGYLYERSPQLTIISIRQKVSPRGTRWSKETETEKLAQHVSPCKRSRLTELPKIEAIEETDMFIKRCEPCVLF